MEEEKDNPYALIGIGHLYYDFREYANAMKYWERMLEVTREEVDIRVLTSLGNCHRKLKTFEKGLNLFKMAFNAQPNNFYALFGLADCYRGLGMQAESLIYWEKILELDPDNKVILTRVGDAYRYKQDFDTAEAYYQRALNIEMDVYAVLGLAMINKAKGNCKEALESLKSLLFNDPKNPRLYIEIADCYLALGNPSEALSTLQRFQKQGLKSSQVTEFLDRLKRENP